MPVNPGTVFLVGAGPGDPGLITVRGLDLIRRADVLIYDQLGAPAFLSSTRSDAEMIDVGKRSGQHTLPQEEINALLVAKAREGKMVVRLKGGDPMVFGRGGEELETLKAAGIPFEVIPGVTSAIAGPSYAGVPVTHRDCTTAMAVVTGHESPTKEDSTIPWASLGGIGTVVFLMGVKNLPSISRKLIEAGKEPETPVAVIEQATTPTQRTLVGTLEEIPFQAAAAGIQPPALIVVGEVVRYHEALGWFQHRPLFGRTVVITGTREQVREQAWRLAELGAQTIECPTLRRVPITPNPAFAAFYADFDKVRDLVFLSADGVGEFFARLWEHGGDLRLLQGKGLVCIGPATVEALARYRIRPDFTAECPRAGLLVPWFSNRPPATVGIVQDEKTREHLSQPLETLGFKPVLVPLYRQEEDPGVGSDLFERLSGVSVGAVLFNDSSCVERFAAWLEKYKFAPAEFPVIALNPHLEETAREKGFPILGQATSHTGEGLLAETVRLLTRTNGPAAGLPAGLASARTPVITEHRDPVPGQTQRGPKHE